ncbi:response regulator transcription factor [Streptomyces sp. NPDC088353]|uniref:response regulator transcription factor n=1 Tax=Streptomyces sp. NPDC088353 TaxID=3365855 RepID=UPI003803D200
MISTIDLREQIATAADELGLPLTLKHVDQLTSQVAVRAAHGDKPRKTLTRQMHAVLVGIASGEESRETAHRLHLSVDTVKTHKLRLYARLGARNAAHAVAIATRLGILPGAEAGGRS